MGLQEREQTVPAFVLSQSADAIIRAIEAMDEVDGHMLLNMIPPSQPVYFSKAGDGDEAIVLS